MKAIEKFNEDLDSILGINEDIKKISDEYLVDCQERQSSASDLISDIKEVIKQVEEKRKFVVDPYRELIADINNRAKDRKGPFEYAEKTLKDKIYDFQQKLLEAKKKEEEKARRKMEKAEEKRRKAIEENKPAPPIPVIPTKFVVPQNVKSERSTTSFRDNWKAEITNKLLAIEYLLKHGYIDAIDINQGKLNLIAKTIKNNKEIDGIKIYNDPIATNRGR